MKQTTIRKKIIGRIVIDREVCKGCGYCINACPKGCIAVEDKFNDSGYFPAVFNGKGECTGCAICAISCPDVAIEVWRED